MTITWPPNSNQFVAKSMVIDTYTNNLNLQGRVLLNGVDLEERISTIEKVLEIPPRDVIMESKYPKLKKIYDQYIVELEKYKTWENIKDSK